jgi:hypothetical protein
MTAYLALAQRCGRCDPACPGVRIERILVGNKTRQGYARKRILKPAGYFFVRPEPAAHGWAGRASWLR